MHLLSFLHALLMAPLLLQPAATGAGGAAGGGGEAAAGGGMSCALQGGMMIAIFALTYFLLLRPERQRQQAADTLQSSLRVGMKVRTTSGILGEILKLNEDNRSLMLGVADKVKINILRANIAGPDAPEADKAEGKAADKPADKAAEEKKA
jgi:preprotein translocase subunit YajC